MIDNSKEYILCSAINYKIGVLNITKIGFRHSDCAKPEYPFTEGFLTSKNRFVDRKEAWNIAKEVNQIIKVSGGEGTLYSEDLW